MSDIIQNRKQNQEYIRQIQQQKADKKKALADKAHSEIKALKESYQEENKEIDTTTTAAINHIQTQADNENKEERMAKAERVSTYTRKGTTQQSDGRANQSSVEQKPITVDHPKKVEQPYSENVVKPEDRVSRISEHDNGYLIEAYAPESEKDSLRMSVQNNKAVLSGKRKFQDTIEQGPKKTSTNNFQTFHEEFKFERPVATDGMTRERNGDTVKFFIPKLESLKFDEES